MATAPTYYTTNLMGHCRITTGVTATDGSGSLTAITWIGAAPSADYLITGLIISASSATGVGNPADCIVNMFLSDGTTHRKVDYFDLADPAVGSVSAPEFRQYIGFPVGQYQLRSAVVPEFSVTVTPTAGNIDIIIFAQQA